MADEHPHQIINECQVVRLMAAPLRSEIKLANDDRAQADVAGANGRNADTQGLIAAAQVFNPGVGIKQVRTQNCARSSNSPCGARSSSPFHAP